MRTGTIIALSLGTTIIVFSACYLLSDKVKLATDKFLGINQPENSNQIDEQETLAADGDWTPAEFDDSWTQAD